jgi:hypothetical protein
MALSVGIWTALSSKRATAAHCAPYRVLDKASDGRFHNECGGLLAVTEFGI